VFRSNKSHCYRHPHHDDRHVKRAGSEERACAFHYLWRALSFTDRDFHLGGMQIARPFYLVAYFVRLDVHLDVFYDD